MIKMQKVIKVGNSLAVTLDREFVRATKLTAGQTIAASYKIEKGVVSLAPSKQNLQGKGVSALLESEKKAVVSGKITPELQKWTDNFIKENKEALEKLANS